MYSIVLELVGWSFFSPHCHESPVVVQKLMWSARSVSMAAAVVTEGIVIHL